MINVRFKFTDGYCFVETSGHASPEVCAAVSAIMQTVGYGLKSLTLSHPDDVCLLSEDWPCEQKEAVRTEGTE